MNPYGPGLGNYMGGPRGPPGPMGPHQGPYGGPGMGPPHDHSNFRGPPPQRFPYNEGSRGMPPKMDVEPQHHGPSESGTPEFSGQSSHFSNRNNKRK